MIIFVILILFLSILMIRTIMFSPKKQEFLSVLSDEFDVKALALNLSDMIKCKTISNLDKNLEDDIEFEKFIQLLKDKYPKVNETCEFKRFDRRAVLYRFKGESDEKPTVLMSHYDVVPADESQWSNPAFDGLIKDNYLWGRGTIDTKITAFGIMENCEKLISSGFIPKNDIYIAFSGDEEVAGNGQPSIVAYFKENNVKPSIVLDEGGAVVEGVFPGVKKETALIGISEKGLLNLKLSLKSNGGHASHPPQHTPVGVLAKAIVKIEKKPFKSQLSPATKQLFDTLGRHSSFIFKMIFANLWLFKPVLDYICKKQGGELNALMRTTCAFTVMQGSDAYNVIPPSANVGANLRLLGEDSSDRAVEYIKKVINNDDIEIEKISSSEPCTFSNTNNKNWDKVKNAILNTWEDVLVSPYLMIAASDSRHYHEICDNVYRFSAMALTKKERQSIHGHDEKISFEQIQKVLEFYNRLFKQL